LIQAALMSGDLSPPPDAASELAAKAEALRDELTAIDERLFRNSAAASLDDELTSLREVALHILGQTDG
jgi:hypothetical protein